MRAAHGALVDRLPYRVLAQDDLPKPALIEAFRAERDVVPVRHHGVLAGRRRARRGAARWWSSTACPFPRPDDPVAQARRERAGAGRLLDRRPAPAATRLAQGAGRLIRSATDRGVVAVLDPRLAEASYRPGSCCRAAAACAAPATAPTSPPSSPPPPTRPTDPGLSPGRPSGGAAEGLVLRWRAPGGRHTSATGRASAAKGAGPPGRRLKAGGQAVARRLSAQVGQPGVGRPHHRVGVRIHFQSPSSGSAPMVGDGRSPRAAEARCQRP